MLVVKGQQFLKTRPQLSLVIPIFNQENEVVSYLEQIKRILKKSAITYELVLVDDGSNDDTLSILQREQNDNVKIISFDRNYGKGYAVKQGVLNTTGDRVMFLDGDKEISSRCIYQFYNELATCDMVIASKRHPHSKVNTTLTRKVLSRLFNILARMLTGISASDSQAGIKAGNGEVMRKIFEMMLVKRYAFDVELLTIASILKLNIREMPVEIILSKRFRTLEIIKMFRDLLAIGYRHRIRNWYRRQLKEN